MASLALPAKIVHNEGKRCIYLRVHYAAINIGIPSTA